MPESTASCFGGGEGTQGSPVALALSGNVLTVQRGVGQTAVQVQLADVPANMQVYSYSFALT